MTKHISNTGIRKHVDGSPSEYKTELFVKDLMHEKYNFQIKIREEMVRTIVKVRKTFALARDSSDNLLQQ